MKISGLALFNIALAIVLLACSLWVSTTADYGIAALPKYCPWADINDDGKIDIKDVAYVASKYGAIAKPGETFVTKAGLKNDSGWVDITDKAGQYFNITHDLNSTDIIVDIQGKTTPDGGPHQRHLGLTGYGPGWTRTYGGPNDDYTRSVIQTSDGGYALAGYTESFGAGGTDGWLVRTDWTGDTSVESGLAWTDSTADTITLYRGATDPTGTTSASASGKSKKTHNPHYINQISPLFFL